MLLGTFGGKKVYVFKGTPFMPQAFEIKAMNALFVRRGTNAYRSLMTMIC